MTTPAAPPAPKTKKYVIPLAFGIGYGLGIAVGVYYCRQMAAQATPPLAVPPPAAADPTVTPIPEPVVTIQQTQPVEQPVSDASPAPAAAAD